MEAQIFPTGRRGTKTSTGCYSSRPRKGRCATSSIGPGSTGCPEWHDNGRKAQDDSLPSRQDRTNSVPWADPPSPVSAGSIVWPDPPPLGNVTNGDAAENARNEKPNPKPEAPATADPSGTVSGDGSGDNNHLVKPAHTTARHTKVPGAVFLVLGSALVIGGVFLGVVVKAFLRRPAPHPDPRGTILAGTAGESGLEGDRSDRDVKEALSELLQVLNRQTT